MKTSAYEADSNLIIAETYYNALSEKSFDIMGKYLHPDVRLISPLAEIFGKGAVLEAAKKLSSILDAIEIRSKFSAGNQIMLAYDFMFSQPIGKLRAAVLMEFQDKLISKIELFYDGRPFESKKDEIFSKN